jgi:hypothetical protein
MFRTGQEFALQVMDPDPEISQAFTEFESTITLGNVPDLFRPTVSNEDIRGSPQDVNQPQLVPVQRFLHNDESNLDVTRCCQKDVESQTKQPDARRLVPEEQRLNG